MQYVIIGNGILGLSTAFRLTQRLSPSDSIVVIGPSDRPGCATFAAAAMLNSFGEISAGSLKSDFDLYHFELSHLATRRWPEFEKELIEAAGDHLPAGCAKCQILTGGCFDRGTYIVNNTAADEWDDRNFEAILQALDDFDEPHELVNPRDIPNYLPAQHSRALRAVYIHNEGWLNPRLVIEKMEAILCNNTQVSMIDGKVQRLERAGDSISSVHLETGDIIEGDEYLLASGASVGKILQASELGLNIQPIFYGLGVSLEISSPDHPHTKCVRTPNRGGACGIYTVPLFLGPDDGKDRIMVGASNRLLPEPKFHGRLGSIEHIMKGAITEINQYFYAARLVRTNVGWRPTTQDTYPLLGKTSVKNLTIATGTKRDGFHLSPVLSDYMATLLMGGSVDDRFDMFAPERSIIRDVTREDAVEIIVASLMSEQYQHGYTPSGIMMDNQVRDTYRRDIQELHDKVGAKDWGIPPELVNMYRLGHAQVDA
ncbi:MAG: FAD-dependent oxidoreductase [Bdellovibrionales bacterium]|nr:FAD-dependent oxidoreductase [Bdellovibrionales bacterium]